LQCQAWAPCTAKLVPPSWCMCAGAQSLQGAMFQASQLQCQPRVFWPGLAGKKAFVARLFSGQLPTCGCRARVPVRVCQVATMFKLHAVMMCAVGWNLCQSAHRRIPCSSGHLLSCRCRKSLGRRWCSVVGTNVCGWPLIASPYVHAAGKPLRSSCGKEACGVACCQGFLSTCCGCAK
jgi:hypothetical protein